MTESPTERTTVMPWEKEPTSEQKPCPKCDWRKGQKVSPVALRMHHIRKHTKGWETGANFKGRGRAEKTTRAQKLALHRKHNADYRARKKVNRAWTPERRKRYLKTIRHRNGIHPLPEPSPAPTESQVEGIGHAAQAIILAAQVLRSVEVGMALVLGKGK